jgi:hypothetical protein
MMRPGLLFHRLRDQLALDDEAKDGGFLGDLGRQTVGFADEAATVASGLGRSAVAGVSGLLRYGATLDPDAAAARVDEVMADPNLTYRPRTEEARENFAQAGNLMNRAGTAIANTKLGHKANTALYDMSAAQPLAMSVLAGSIDLLGPGKGKRAVVDAAEDALQRETRAFLDRPGMRDEQARISVDNRNQLLSDGGAPVFLNVGMKIGDTVGLTPEQVVAALEKRGVRVTAHEVRESGTEPTVIAQLDRPLTKREADGLSEELQQEAIAQKVGDEGELFGPSAEKWGPFNDEFFLKPEGPKVPAQSVRSTKRKAVDAAARESGQNVKRADLVDDQAQVQARIVAANQILDADQRQPLDLEAMERTSLFDRKLIEQAMEGHPGVAQVPMVRGKAARASTQGEIDQRVGEIFHEPANRDLLKRQIDRGRGLGGETYYPSSHVVREQLQDPEQFRRVIAAHAGTSPQTALPNNFASQSLMTHAMDLGLDPSVDYAAIKKLGDDLAAERGHQKYFLSPSHSQNVGNLLAGTNEADKIGGYYENLSGNFKPGVLDTHESKGSTIGSKHYPFYERQKGLAENEYGAFEEQYAELGEQLGLSGGTAGVQAPRWFGGGQLTGLKGGTGDWLSTLEHMVLYSSEKLGLSMKRSALQKYADDVLRGKATLVPYYPTKQNPLPKLTRKVEAGFINPKLLAGMGAAGLLGAYAFSGDDAKEDAKKNAEKLNSRTERELREMEQ